MIPKVAFIDWKLRGNYREPTERRVLAVKGEPLLCDQCFVVTVPIGAFCPPWVVVHISVLALLITAPVSCSNSPALGNKFYSMLPLPRFIEFYLFCTSRTDPLWGRIPFSFARHQCHMQWQGKCVSNNHRSFLQGDKYALCILWKHKCSKPRSFLNRNFKIWIFINNIFKNCFRHLKIPV